jgi:lipopolysaccharide export system protein LptA
MKLWMIILLLALPQCVAAAPMTVDADRFELVQGEQRADFFGHVVVKRDDMILKADEMRVWYQQVEETGKKTLEKVEATGHVTIFTPDSQGSSDLATFMTGSDILVMKGKANMTSTQGTVEGEHIEYNVKTKDTKVIGGQDNGQVRFTFDDTESEAKP